AAKRAASAWCRSRSRRKRNQHTMQSLSIVVAVVLTTVALFPVAASGQGQADLVLVRGKIWTENPRQPEVEAVAIQGNRIVEVGDSDTVLKLAGPKTRVV